MRNIIRSFQVVHWQSSILPEILLFIILAMMLVSTSCRTTPPSTPPPTPVATKPVTTPSVVSTPATLEVPITVRSASNLGSLQMELRFDPQALELQGVKAGALGRNTMIDSNQPTTGRLLIGMVAASGISGDGDIIMISFKLTGKGSPNSLTIEKAEATNTSLRELVISPSPAQINGNGTLVSGLVLTFRR